jgi:hypothetical protein
MMNLFKNGIDLHNKLREYVSNSLNLFIFSPYIKLETLKKLLDDQDNVKAVIVRWEPKDLIQGSSDLEIYPFLKERGITLYRNPRLHLKAYLDNYKKCFLTTANISSRALNIPEYSNYNYELGTIIDNLTFEDRLYFKIIENDSMLITANIYMQICEQINEQKNSLIEIDDFDLKIFDTDKKFMISSLPMSHSIETVYRVYNGELMFSDEEINCALHDLAIYNIPLGLPYTEFIEKLNNSFFEHPFIEKFKAYLELSGGLYFGATKEWIHKNCEDVPTPRRWEITENIQILYRWIVELGNGRYQVDRPNFSERLYRVH